MVCVKCVPEPEEGEKVKDNCLWKALPYMGTAIQKEEEAVSQLKEGVLIRSRAARYEMRRRPLCRGQASLRVRSQEAEMVPDWRRTV